MVMCVWADALAAMKDNVMAANSSLRIHPPWKLDVYESTSVPASLK